MADENVAHKFLFGTGTASLAIAYIGKKFFKKELLPVSGWKQMLSTYFTIAGGGYLSALAITEWNKRNLPAPKPK